MVTRNESLQFLRVATGGRAVAFVDGQWEAIDAIANQRGRVLLVQATGWGKSMVYFLATRALRDAGAGPTLIVSPLLALMRNQLHAARALDLVAETINSDNRDDREEITRRVIEGQVDLLLISPEMLANDQFVAQCLIPIAGRIAFMVVDEAHCISDWGHDFRPDYRRIERIIRQLPANVAVLATTATANERVVHDVMEQLGPRTSLQRGPLTRASLQLQAQDMPDRATRLAWLVDALRALPGSGIVYTSTVRDAERVAQWLMVNGIEAKAYHGQISQPGEDAEDGAVGREELEEMLLRNQVKALVCTNALGMGFDKPDLRFVIHFQTPQSIVAYYQQVGRAGRDGQGAVGILLHGAEDDEINDFFIEHAFPPQWQMDSVLQALGDAEEGASAGNLTRSVNLRQSQIEKILKLLSVSEAAPVTKVGGRWFRTANPAHIDPVRISSLTQQRRAEAAQVQSYIRTAECRMGFLAAALDDPGARRCGRCENCIGHQVLHVRPNRDTIVAAARFIKRSEVVLPHRKKWDGSFPRYGWRGNIAPALRAADGRALGIWKDAGWGPLVEAGKEAGRFSDDLVRACAEMIRDRWAPDPFPTWVTCVPSLRSPELVPDFSRRLAAALGLPFRAEVEKVTETQRQRSMMNGWQQASNLDGAFVVVPDRVDAGPVLLVDDVADSRWSLTVIGALLRAGGSGTVYPCVLALASGAN